MVEVSRRGFLGLLAGAIAASAVSGSAVLASTEPNAKKLKARHLYGYDVMTDEYVHRIDVVIEDRVKGAAQYGVNFQCLSKEATKQEIEPAIEQLCNYIETQHGKRFDLEVRSFKAEDYESYQGFFTKKIGEK